VHAIASTPEGPFKYADTALPVFHHNAAIAKFNGTYLLYFIGNTLEAKDVKNCTKASKRGIEEDEEVAHSRLRAGNSGIIGLAYSTSLNGPWNLLNGGANLVDGTQSTWFATPTNPAPYVLANGTILLVFHAGNSSTGPESQSLGLAVADSWEGPYRLITVDEPLFRGDNEDPVLYTDVNGYYHILTHREDLHQDPLGADRGAGGHAYSKDLYNWQLSPYAPYQLTIPLLNGTSLTNTTLFRRERPQVIKDASGNLAYLYNGCETVAGGSHSFSIVSKVNLP